ncbi:hypothetical protein TELCIR_00399 [Teladorsagia circumcincta]|uniref:Uncharacterized protein n=1 Tax=Teladorsagia circumcincta TaxID=45464 RepID=A0A2G9V4U2_TELCI|nr:hypothetical protein TELCIR_00399 [Teladorsagia circumcincta]
MGVDETSCTSLTEHNRTESSAALMNMAVDHNSNGDLLKKIADLCHCGGDGVTRPALRMEMCEMKGLSPVLRWRSVPSGISVPSSSTKPTFPRTFTGSNWTAGGLSKRFKSTNTDAFTNGGGVSAVSQYANLIVTFLWFLAPAS